MAADCNLTGPPLSGMRSLVIVLPPALYRLSIAPSLLLEVQVLLGRNVQRSAYDALFVAPVNALDIQVPSTVDVVFKPATRRRGKRMSS